ncbi:hypothetical protein F5I97DRAFT_1378264 [Phlebopus sp. FC_14]|nr:hypothetical protein F5I97DRAFT_1378264 [Phlebopus sp. FC_14]
MHRCHRCSQSHNGPQAFLLTCRDCSRTWHHRCHIPPIQDAELIQRIRANNAGDAEHNLSAWRCRRCSAKRPASPAESVAMEVDTPHTSPSAEPSTTQPESVPPSADAGAQARNDDDDLYGPPVERRVVRIYPSLAEELREQSRREEPDRPTTKVASHGSTIANRVHGLCR